MPETIARSRIRAEISESLKLAVPLAAAQVSQATTGFIDTIMMGRMGADILAAGGLAAVIFLSIVTTASGIVMGVSPLTAEAFGAGQQRRVRQIACQGLWLALVVTIPVTILTAYLDRWLANAGQAETTIGLADTYLDIVLWGLFPILGLASLRATVSSVSQARPVMLIVVAGTICNIIGNYILGFGQFGLPRMELAGLALSSAIAQWGMFFALAVYVLKHPKLQEYQIFRGLYQFRPQIFGEIARVGIPIGALSGLESGFFLIIMFWMGTLGTEALAAHQIVLQTIAIVFMVPLGISYATTVRVGQWLGQRDLAGIQRAAWVGIGTSIVFGIGVSTVFLLFPRGVIGIYLDMQNPSNTNIVTLALPLLIIAAIAQTLDGLQKAVYGSLQGLQDTQVPMLLNVLGYWGIGLPLGYGLAFHLGMGSRGLWIGQSIAISVVAGLFAWRLRQLLARQKRRCEATDAETCIPETAKDRLAGAPDSRETRPLSSPPRSKS